MRELERSLPTGYVVSTWPRLSQTFVLNEILALERLGMRLRIFSGKDPGDEPVHAEVRGVRAPVAYLSLRRQRRQVLRANLQVARAVPAAYTRGLLYALRLGSAGVLRRFWQAGYLANMLRAEPVAHLHAHFATAPALIAMFTHWLTGVPYSFTAHAKDIYVDTSPSLLRAEMEHAAAVVTISEYNRTYLNTRVAPNLNGKVRCVYNGLHLNDFEFCPPSARRAEPPMILAVSRLVEKKGLRDLITAAGVLRERGVPFDMEIIGAGPLDGALRAQVQAAGLHNQVRMPGAQPQAVVRGAYARATLFVLPCVVTAEGDRDGIPTVLLEAMASGVPVISTPVSGIPELIESGREGVLVEPNAPALLADAIAQLLGCTALRERLALAARQRIESHFNVERSANVLSELFNEVQCASPLPVH